MTSKRALPHLKSSYPEPGVQPAPGTPGISRRMVRTHAFRVFRDVVALRPLTYAEWRSAEADLVRRMENDGW